MLFFHALIFLKDLVCLSTYFNNRFKLCNLSRGSQNPIRFRTRF